MSNFETTIQTYLENRAKTDSLFAETYKKANKSIKECCKYIYSRARKLAAGGKAVGIDDATVYGWAVHYYDEDDIKVDKVQERVEVVAPVAIQKPVKEEYIVYLHDIEHRGKALRFFIGDRVQVLLGRGGEELLILNEADSAVQQEEICRHDDKRRKQGYRHFSPAITSR